MMLDQTAEGDRVRLTYLSEQTGNRVERTGEVFWDPPGGDPDMHFVETDEGSRLTVTHHYVTVKQSGSNFGNSRLIGTEATIEVIDE